MMMKILPLMKPQEVGSIETGLPQITATAALNSADMFFIMHSLDCKLAQKLKIEECCSEILFETLLTISSYKRRENLTSTSMGTLNISIKVGVEF